MGTWPICEYRSIGFILAYFCFALISTFRGFVVFRPFESLTFFIYCDLVEVSGLMHLKTGLSLLHSVKTRNMLSKQNKILRKLVKRKCSSWFKALICLINYSDIVQFQWKIDKKVKIICQMKLTTFHFCRFSTRIRNWSKSER